jgi:hypothetical protein
MGLAAAGASVIVNGRKQGKWKPRDWPLERTIRAALKNLGNREVVQRALDLLDKSLRKAKPSGNA